MREKVNLRPFFGQLPAWVLDDPAFEGLGPGDRYALHIIAGQCKKEVDAAESQRDRSRRGCSSGATLRAKIGIGRASWWGMLDRLEGPGFVVVVDRGSGSRSNELAVPGRRGALDHVRARPRRRPDSGRPETGRRGARKPDGSAHGIQAPGARDQGAHTPSSLSLEYSPSSGAAGSANGAAPLADRKRSGRGKGKGKAPSGRGDAGARQAGRKGSGPDPDVREQVKREIPDSADPDQVSKILRARGVSGKRAKKFAHNSLCTPEIARAAILAPLTSNNPVGNAGGYIADRLEALLAEAREEARSREADVEDERASALEAIVDGIRDGTVADAEIEAARPKSLPAAEVSVAVIRADAAIRDEIARRIERSRVATAHAERQGAAA